MKLRVIGLIALGCVGALGFGVLANACFDMIWPAAGNAAATVAAAQADPVSPAVVAKDADLVGTTDVRPLKVKTVQITLASPDPAMAQVPAASPPRPVAIPQANPPPANPSEAAKPAARQASAAAPIKTARATRPEDNEDILSVGQIDRIRAALALTPEQESYWPAVAAELRTIAKQQPKSAIKAHPPKLTLDPDAVQRLYWAAAPLITRLTEEQKRKARELALLMGLQEVAQAL